MPKMFIENSAGGVRALRENDLAGGGVVTAAVPQGVAALQVVKATPGRLCRIVITTAGTESISIYDHASAASGKKLFTTPATSALGSIYDIQMPAELGITVAAQTANTPAFTVSYT